MAILLDTAFDPGDFDPGKTYDYIEIDGFHPDKGSKTIRITIKYLDQDENDGKVRPQLNDFVIQNNPKAGTTAFDDFKAKLPIAKTGGVFTVVAGDTLSFGEPVWDDFLIYLYNYIKDNHPIYEGQVTILAHE